MPDLRRLSLAVILDAAIDVADHDGLDAVSMRRLAKDLDVTPMAFYWHVANRTALVDAMAARVVEDAEIPALSQDPWPDQLRAALTAVADVLRAHPWMGSIASTRYVRSPAYLRLLDTLIGTMQRAGLPVETAVPMLGVAIDSLVAVAAAAPVDDCGPNLELSDYFAGLDEHPHVQQAADQLAVPTPDPVALAVEMTIDAVRARAEA